VRDDINNSDPGPGLDAVARYNKGFIAVAIDNIRYKLVPNNQEHRHHTKRERLTYRKNGALCQDGPYSCIFAWAVVLQRASCRN
jgi:hypothetical protein